jgi:branched-chain amino acid transport system ATP-binding protein
MTPALRAQGLSKRFGGFLANSGIDLALPAGARHALIGPNGAGKTTFVNLLTGVLPATSGDVFLGDERVTPLPQHERVRRGMARTFQINKLFSGLTVLESVVLAVCVQKGLTRVWQKAVTQQRDEIDEARELLGRLFLLREAHVITRRLSYGKQRLMEIALALATRPKILLLDEPAAGIPTHERAEVLGVIERLPEEVGVLLIEHDMDMVFRFAERITVLANGSVLAEGSAAEIAADPRVREVYLGEAEHA